MEANSKPSGETEAGGPDSILTHRMSRKEQERAEIWLTTAVLSTAKQTRNDGGLRVRGDPVHKLDKGCNTDACDKEHSHWDTMQAGEGPGSL
jgi:hypothetical protein